MPRPRFFILAILQTILFRNCKFARNRFILALNVGVTRHLVHFIRREFFTQPNIDKGFSGNSSTTRRVRQAFCQIGFECGQKYATLNINIEFHLARQIPIIRKRMSVPKFTRFLDTFEMTRNRFAFLFIFSIGTSCLFISRALMIKASWVCFYCPRKTCLMLESFESISTIKSPPRRPMYSFGP